MKNTRFENRSSEWLGDMTVWRRANAEDNGEQMTRLRRNLRLARERELTERQREMVALYYDQGMTMPQIAERLGVNRSTVSRTLRRARDKLHRFLRYTL
ncbi:sigma-70 family RNA polymerase sigma factor [Oscillospiraceae bacterium 50-60]